MCNDSTTGRSPALFWFAQAAAGTKRGNRPGSPFSFSSRFLTVALPTSFPGHEGIAEAMPYQSIGDYGVIGNMRTAALVGKNGSIDWLCFPRFDSPSIFGAILDDQRGGRFKIAPAAPGAITEQSYLPDTNVLVTRFIAPDGAVELTDFMPLEPSSKDDCRVIRQVTATRGSMKLWMECDPAPNYGRDTHRVEINGQAAVFRSEALSLGLASDAPLAEKDGGVRAEFTLKARETAAFLLHGVTESGYEGHSGAEESSALLEETVDYWRQWISKCSYRGRWREMVHRSALTLELLVYEPTGAVVAAVTSSLPEKVGGERNWDYRYSWMRDSAFTVYALLRIGLVDEADRFMSWIESRCDETKQGALLQTVYGIDGRRELTEQQFSHWEGYKGSRPVRIGNAAHQQLQLDIFGELLDATYLYNKYRNPISSDLWSDLRLLADWVAENWQQQDCGIWEVRGAPQQFVYSKVMCWVALDRALRIAMKRSLPADYDRWIKSRDQIYGEILKRGWNRQRRAFVQTFEGASLDASNLVMPLVFFMAPHDPKMLQTLEAICRTASEGGLLEDGLVRRYDTAQTEDGLRGGEGSFNMCTFWLVEALTRAGRSEPAILDRALWLFQRMLTRANHLGLYSEETGIAGEPLGNIPQALAHLAFISAAVNLDSALGERESSA
jgi:GH15 family glucan-1,4-alpha-glucosidase